MTLTLDHARSLHGSAAGAMGSAGSALPELSAVHGLPEPLEGYIDTADGTRLRYAHWPAEAAARQGTVLYLNGRTEFIEKTIETYGILHRSGFDVWTLDWRGQGLSTRALDDREKGHVTDYQLFLDDLDQVIREVTDLTTCSGRKIMLAHSMGAHIGFRYLHDHPDIFDAAAFSAPMLDLFVNNIALRALNAAIMGCGLGEKYALGTRPFRFAYNNPNDPSDNGRLKDYRGLTRRFKSLTHDAAKFMQTQELIRHDRRLALGGPTSAWVAATFRSINLTWSPGYAEAMKTPILMVGGGRDRVVITTRQEAMVKRLPKGRFQCIDCAAHELLVECDDVRCEFFSMLQDFIGIPIERPTIDMSGCLRS